MTETSSLIALAALGAGYFLWKSNKDTKAQETQTLSAAIRGIKPASVQISNVEAIEERRVWEFTETDALFAEFAYAESLKRAWTAARNTTGDEAFFAITDDPTWAKNTGSVLQTPDLSTLIVAPGRMYDKSPRSPGSNPMSYTGLLAVIYSNPPAPGGKGGARSGYAYRIAGVASIDPAVWARCWSSRIATAGQQIEAGGVVSVETQYL